MYELTREQLHEMIPNASDTLISRYYAVLMEAMEEFNINIPKRIAAFIAQITHESASLHYVEEIADGSAYEYRADLGNLEPEALAIAHQNYSTTGKFYKGRGLIQLTGYYNYAKASKAMRTDYVHYPKLLCTPAEASRISAWFFDVHNCNSYADVGLFDKITHTINGGYNGKHERDICYARCKKVLGI